MTLAWKSRHTGIDCAFMTVPLRFCDTSQFPAATSAFWPPPAQGRRPCRVCRVPMAPPPNSSSSIAVIAGGLAALGVWRLLAVAAPHLGALLVMLQTETDLGSRIGFVLAW